MGIIKSYTDIEQSKKLAEILPLESADMYWDLLSKSKYAKVNNIGCRLGRTCVYAWSLAALLSVLPSASLDNSDDHHFRLHCMEKFTEWHDNPIDACVEMICKLHERKIL